MKNTCIEPSGVAEWVWRTAFVAMAGLVWLGGLPKARLFSFYAFADTGSEMLLPRLSRILGAPTQAYFYSYGVLCHWSTMRWLQWFGDTPRSMMLADMALVVAFYFALCGVGRRMQLGWRGRFFLLAMFLLMPTPPYRGMQNIAESVLMLAALREQARGRPTRALVACVLAALFKPAMALFYGAWLLWELWRRERSGRRWLNGLIAPAGVAGASLLLMLIWYPPRAVLAMENPLKSVRNYRDMHFGFFHSQGRQFWYPAGKHFAYYLGTAAGVWLAGTLLLFTLAVVAWLWPRRLELAPHHRDIVFTCAILHGCDICFLYSYGGSWSHYAFFLVIGLAPFIDRPELRWRAGMAAFILLTWLGCTTSFRRERSLLALRPQPDMAGLYASDADAAEWSAVIREARGHKVLVVTDSGGVGLLTPAVEGPTRWMLLPGAFRPAELQSVKAQFASADLVVLPIGHDDFGDPAWAVVATLLGDFRTVRRGDYYWVFAHSGAPAS